MAKLSKPPIPLKMYKHFAIMTLSLTAGIAMFADSDTRQYKAGRTEVVLAQQSEIRTARDEPIIRTTPVAAVSRTVGSFGSEENDGYGSPTVTPVSASGRSGFHRATGSEARARVAGYDQDTIEMMTEEEYRAFLDALPPETVESMVSPEQRAEQIAALERASASRSGRRSSGVTPAD